MSKPFYQEMNGKDKLATDITKIMVISHFADKPINKPKTALEILDFEKRAIEQYQNNPLFHARVSRDVALIMHAIDKRLTTR